MRVRCSARVIQGEVQCDIMITVYLKLRYVGKEGREKAGVCECVREKTAPLAQSSRLSWHISSTLSHDGNGPHALLSC